MPFTELQAKALQWEGKDRLVSVDDSLYLNVRHKSKTRLLCCHIRGKVQVSPFGKCRKMAVKEACALALQVALEDMPSEKTVDDLA